jgi:glycine betaine/proline transport system substrate-binding protein
MSPRLTRRILALAVMTLIIGAVPTTTMAQLPGEGRTIRPARASWDTFWFGGFVIETAMKRLGYKIADWKTLSGPAMYQAIAQGDVDLTPDTVMPFSEPSFEKFAKDILNIGPIVDPGSVNGYIIDKASSEKYDIRYISDLLDPAKAKVFDSDGDGKADMVGPNAGWGSEKTVLDDFKRLRLDKTVKLVQGEYNILVADAVSRFKAGKPVLIFAWYPNTATVKIRPGREAVWLHFKEGEAPAALATANIEGCAAKVALCNTGSAATKYFATVNREWAAKNPAALKFLSRLKMSLDDRVEQNTRMMNGENKEADIRRHADEWIANNRAKFDAWIEEAKKAK